MLDLKTVVQETPQAELERRWRRMKLHVTTFTPAFLSLLRGEAKCLNLPADASVVRLWFEPERDIWQVVIASAEYEPVAQFAMIPEGEFWFENTPKTEEIKGLDTACG